MPNTQFVVAIVAIEVSNWITPFIIFVMKCIPSNGYGMWAWPTSIVWRWIVRHIACFVLMHFRVSSPRAPWSSTIPLAVFTTQSTKCSGCRSTFGNIYCSRRDDHQCRRRCGSCSSSPSSKDRPSAREYPPRYPPAGYARPSWSSTLMREYE